MVVRFSSQTCRWSRRAVAADTSEFRRLKQARDDMSHGSVANTAALPVNEVEALAGRYLGLALEAIASGD